jgi:hypothetical protein
VSPRQPDGVILPAGLSASTLLHGLLRDAAERFPSLAEAALPASAETFRKGFPEAIVRFEAARAASDERVAIARSLVEASHRALRAVSGGRELSLDEAAALPAEPFELEQWWMAGSGRLVPSVPYAGRAWRGRDVVALADELCARDLLAPAARDALAWLIGSALDTAGEIDLAGRRFALLGAGAELAPTPLLLEAGAEVLWLDLAPPLEALTKDSALSGRVLVPRGGANLLLRPASVTATLARFADPGPIDVGLYAYAPGAGREWRLEAAMNAIVDALPPPALRSVALLVSPTAPLPLGAAERAARARRAASLPAWQRLLGAAGLLGSAEPVRADEVQLPRLVVALQGASYQAAQYLEKVLAAERWAADPERRFTLSANVAGISRTRSLSHPLFEAAYAGAPAFGVETFAPETTRALNGLLLLHDLLNPDAPGAPRAAGADPARLFAERFHGGFHAVPWSIDPALRAAALFGLARRPALLGRLLRRR